MGKQLRSNTANGHQVHITTKKREQENPIVTGKYFDLKLQQFIKVIMKEDTSLVTVQTSHCISHLELKIRFQFGDFICCVKYFNVTYISDIELHKPKIALQKFPDGYCGLQYSKVLIKRLYEICVIPPLELLGNTHKWNLKADITLIFASRLSWSERYKENEVLSRTKSDCGEKRLV